MSSCLLKSLCLLSLRSSGARHVGNKLMAGWFQNFSVYLGNTLAKKLLKTQQKPLRVMSAMVLAYLNILPTALVWFFNNSWDYLFYRRTHDPMLEKFGIKNLAVCENQGKQHKLRVMKKKAGRRWCKKDKRLTELINKFQQKILHKKKKVMQLVKPNNYWVIPANAQSS